MSRKMYQCEILIEDVNECVVKFQIIDHRYAMIDGPEVAAEGHLKWDGCSNLSVGRECAWHSCNETDVDTLHALLKEAHGMCRDRLKELGTWDGN